MKRSLVAFALGAPFAFGAAARADDFSYAPPGDLVPGSGSGRVDFTVYAPGIRFPIENAPAFANSQVWTIGGSKGPPGDKCDAANFSYPWRDNFCETRSWDMPLCPAGIGHQGQDIRASTCEKGVHPTVACADATVTHIGSYTVYITTADGTRFDYGHMSNVAVSVGQVLKRGDHIATVSNEFGGTPTGVHLHFNIRQNVEGVGNVFVPPYMSLVGAYEELVGPITKPSAGALDGVECAAIAGWSQDPDSPEKVIGARVWFDGTPDDAPFNGATLEADLPHDDCGAGVSCKHGFETGLPNRMLDGESHTVRGYGHDDETGINGELEGSPHELTCPRTVPKGVRRTIINSASFGAWHLSTFWDVMVVTAAELDERPKGDDLPLAPRVVRAVGATTDLYVIDGDRRRPVTGEDVVKAWDFAMADVEEISASELESFALGLDLPPRPFVAKAPSGDLWLLDGSPTDAGAGFFGGTKTGQASEDTSVADSGCACGLAPELPDRDALASPWSARTTWLVVGIAVVAALARRRIQLLPRVRRGVRLAVERQLGGRRAVRELH